MKKIILDLCGGTGAWSRPYAEDERFDVRIITLPRYNVFDTIINDNTITFFDQLQVTHQQFLFQIVEYLQSH